MALAMGLPAQAQLSVGVLAGAAVPTGGNSRYVVWGPALSLEGSYRFEENSLRVGVNLTSAAQGDNSSEATFPDARLRSLAVTVNAWHAFNDYGFQPYFGLGAGALFRNGESSPENSPGRVAQNDVVPIVTPQLGLRLTLKHLEVDSRVSFLTNLSAGEEDQLSKPFSGAFLALQLGLHYRW